MSTTIECTAAAIEPEVRDLLREIAAWIENMPVPTKNATAMLMKIDSVLATPTVAAPTQPDHLSQILDTLADLVKQGRASEALTISTSAFVSLLINYLEARGQNTNQDIFVNGGDERDITVHAPKSVSKLGKGT